MDMTGFVWAPDTSRGFRLGTVVDLGSSTISVEPLDCKGTVSFQISRKLPAHCLIFDVNPKWFSLASFFLVNVTLYLGTTRVPLRHDVKS